MVASTIALHESVSFAELRSLAGAAGPCITIATILPNPLEVRVRLKNAVRGIETQLSSSERDQTAAGLLDPIRDAAGAIEANGVWGKALLVLRSPDIFLGYWLRDWRREILNVGDRFQLRPLLAAMAREQRFYLLGVSQGQVWLYESSMFRAEEVKLPASVPGNLQQWMNARQPDHVLDNRSTGGPSKGSMKGVVFGTSTDREKRNEYLRHYFKEIDKGVHQVLRDRDAPMVLAGVQEELAIYRRISTYPNLSEKEIHGSPDRLGIQALLEEARDLLSQSPSEALRRVFAALDRHPMSWDAREIPEMASEGRIENLLIPEDTEDERLDLAAVETLRHGGGVFAVKPEEMPRNAEAMAELRH
jgi:hypothetical protein